MFLVLVCWVICVMIISYTFQCFNVILRNRYVFILYNLEVLSITQLPIDVPRYHRPASPAENYVDDREREVMRFYRGSSKERRFHEQHHYEQERNNGRYLHTWDDTL